MPYSLQLYVQKSLLIIHIQENYTLSNMIEIKNINKTFGDRHVVKDVSFKFETGKTNLIIGESGSGKTTILKLMVGLHDIDAGEVLYDGKTFQP